MKTECPHCNTIFAITEEQLDFAEGMVRCGVCEQVFSALVQDDLFVEGASETEAIIADEYTEELNSDIPVTETVTEISDDPHRESTADAHVDEITPDSDVLFDGADGFVVPDDIRYQDSRPSLLSTALWSLCSITLLLILTAQAAWLERNSLMQNAYIKPYLDELCQKIDCSRLNMRAPDKMELTSRNVYTHPTVDAALMISLTLVNRASFAQAYPDIRIHFSDRIGTVIAARQLRPREYLALDPAHIRPLLPDEPVSFAIEIKDPGTTALTYEFEFL